MMLEFALHPGECTKISQVAKRQQISVKYLEQIVTILCRAGYVKSVRGAQGGYLLSRDPSQYTVGQILRLTEGNLAPVACLETEENACERCGTCPTLDFWTGLYAVVNDYVDRFTLADLVREELAKGGEAPASPET